MGLFDFFKKRELVNKGNFERINYKNLKAEVLKTIRENRDNPMVGYIVLNHFNVWQDEMSKMYKNEYPLSDMTDEEIDRVLLKVYKQVHSEVMK